MTGPAVDLASATEVLTIGSADVAMGASGSSAVWRRAGSAAVTVVGSLAVLTVLWWAMLKVFDVSKYIGKTPVDVYHYLFTAGPQPGIRPGSLTAEAARSQLFSASLITLRDAGIGFVTGLLVALLVAAAFVLFRPVEFAFMPIAMLLRSVPLVAMAPVLLLIFGQGTAAIATIGAIVVLFPALVNITLGLRAASVSALDLIAVNGGSRWTALRLVRLPSSLPYLMASVRISVPGAIVGAMLAEWLSGFTGLGGILNSYKGSGNFGGVWAVVVVAVGVSIVLYAASTVVEAGVLGSWGPEAGLSR